jgi:hypothetical protein
MNIVVAFVKHRYFHHEADSSFPRDAGSKNVWSYTVTPQYAFLALWIIKCILMQ